VTQRGEKMAPSSKVRQRAHERRAQRRRQQQMRVMIGIGVGALILAALLILISRPPDTSVAETGIDYTGLEQSIDDSLGAPGYVLGNPDAAVTLVDYSDFSCPHCRDLAPVIHRLVDEYVRDGRLRVVYKSVSFVNPPTSEAATSAMICAAEQGKAWEMHDQIWAINEDSGPGAYTQAVFAARAAGLGLDSGQFNSCYTSAETRSIIEAINAEASGRGVVGTPTIFVNDQHVPNTLPDEMYLRLVDAIQAALGS